jgi:hypothetical protein
MVRRDERVGWIGTARWIVEQDEIAFDALEEQHDEKERNAQETIHFLNFF